MTSDFTKTQNSSIAMEIDDESIWDEWQPLCTASSEPLEQGPLDAVDQSLLGEAAAATAPESESLDGWEEFILQPTSFFNPVTCAAAAALAPHSADESSNQVGCNISSRMYGAPDDLKYLGEGIQKNMFQEFSSVVGSAQRKGSADLLLQQQTLEDTLATEFVHTSAYKSMQSEAGSTNRAPTSLSRNILEYACALAYGAAFLVGAFLHAWTTLFNRKKYRPVAAVTKWKYDETYARF